MSPRWWNTGRYERECVEFDAEHPLSREVWESLQRMRWRSWFADFVVTPKDSLLLREPAPDPWQEFADRVYREHMNRWYASNPVVFAGL
jgi:hypothetical protein